MNRTVFSGGLRSIVDRLLSEKIKIEEAKNDIP